VTFSRFYLGGGEHVRYRDFRDRGPDESRATPAVGPSSGSAGVTRTTREAQRATAPPLVVKISRLIRGAEDATRPLADIARGYVAFKVPQE